jgi:hypothetical protein
MRDGVNLYADEEEKVAAEFEPSHNGAQRYRANAPQRDVWQVFGNVG